MLSVQEKPSLWSLIDFDFGCGRTPFSPQFHIQHNRTVSHTRSIYVDLSPDSAVYSAVSARNLPPRDLLLPCLLCIVGFALGVHSQTPEAFADGTSMGVMASLLTAAYTTLLARAGQSWITKHVDHVSSVGHMSCSRAFGDASVPITRQALVSLDTALQET